jgi:RNA polymerase sigma-54 factor
MSSFNQKLYQSAQLRQEMRINPRLYQAMELLYMPLLDLEQHLKQQLDENPFLEMTEADVGQEVELKEDTKDEPLGDDVDWEEIILDGFDVGGRRQQYEHKEFFEPTPVESKDLHDHLNEQLRLQSLSERELRLGEEIIGDIDDSGMLACGLDEAVRGVNEWLDEVRPTVVAHAEAIEEADERAAELREIEEVFRPYTLVEAERMLRVIQALDPPGVGARDVRESILIQLEQRDEAESITYKVVAEHFDALINHRWTTSPATSPSPPRRSRTPRTRSAASIPSPGSSTPSIPSSTSSRTSSSRRSTESTWSSRTIRASRVYGSRSPTGRSRRTRASSRARTRSSSRAS